MKKSLTFRGGGGKIIAAFIKITMKMKTKISIITAAALAATASAFAQDNTYYLVGNSPTDASSWNTAADGSGTALPAFSKDVNLVSNSNFWSNWFFLPNQQLVNSITLNLPNAGSWQTTTFNLNASTYVATVGDFVANISQSAMRDVSVDLTQIGQNGVGKNGFNVGGNLVMNSEKYLKIRMSADWDSSYTVYSNAQEGSEVGADGKTYTWKYASADINENPTWNDGARSINGIFNVGKQMQFNHTGDSGFIRFQVSEAKVNSSSITIYETYEDSVNKTNGKTYTNYQTNTGTVVMNGKVGGLDGKGVFSASKWVSTELNLNLESDTFVGGDFKGAFTKYSAETYSADDSNLAKAHLAQNAGNVVSTFNITMNGEGTQKLTIVKAANAASKLGISGIESEEDMTFGKLTVQQGNLEIETELAVGELILNGGSLKFSSPEKVASVFLNNGKLVYAEAIKAGELMIDGTGIFEVDFTGAGNLADEILLISYDSLIFEGDVDSVFSAIRNGTALDGTFSIHDNGIYFTAAVPEPATVAALLGLAALGLAIARRRR